MEKDKEKDEMRGKDDEKKSARIVSMYMTTSELEVLTDYMIENRIFSYSAACKKLLVQGIKYEEINR